MGLLQLADLGVDDVERNRSDAPGYRLRLVHHVGDELLAFDLATSAFSGS